MSEFITAIVMTLSVCCHAIPRSLTEISACTWRQNTPIQQWYTSITLHGITSQKAVTCKEDPLQQNHFFQTTFI